LKLSALSKIETIRGVVKFPLVKLAPLIVSILEMYEVTFPLYFVPVSVIAIRLPPFR
jgi:hypothetical protein